ncbi:BirA family transcriptional regulator, biotin operon repressor / biotin-[acetyl-CoA-carboxylase] ligase [Tranquillimonas rosea]|uniref:biotin--[biotin carboxyl-carrier protein] ligase n=1 Tax=Tranquillimonas rosea TaxID=641238 RepID=A0A1H9Q3C9_9RHOB|nr:biotin--[acetyl-CoA-carboxylase] ligase [Tranquillimonas rosea]SER54459.1 BirA family transcriptional regulator, biotin operon repressor / biotin-[acetyl-CoA-carboxylase] ligase [Tranquillimonas rosea]
MSTEAPWPEGFDRIVLDRVDSTNAEAARIAGELNYPTWILAREQTAARGRRGVAWANPAGNFAATLVMRPGGVPAWAALRSFLAANALFEALAMRVDRTRLSLKWPNDVLLDNGKVAGILLESAGPAGQVEWLSIGIGVNLVMAPDDVRDAVFPPVSVAEATGVEIEPEEFLVILADAYATQESILTRLGFPTIREHWLRHAARLGEVITARTGREEIVGRFETIDEHGQLVLETPDGRRAVPAADVFF